MCVCVCQRGVLCERVQMRACTYLYLCLLLHVYVYVCMYMHVSVRVCVSVHACALMKGYSHCEDCGLRKRGRARSGQGGHGIHSAAAANCHCPSTAAGSFPTRVRPTALLPPPMHMPTGFAPTSSPSLCVSLSLSLCVCVCV